MANIILETPRLILREFVPEDLAGLYRLYEESDTRYIDPLSEDPDEELVILKNYIHYIYGFYGFGLWAVCLKETGELIGRCGLHVMFIADEGEYELGYMISRPYEGQGYAAEAVRAIINYAEEELEAPRVVIKVHEENCRSIQFAEHIWFKKFNKILKDEPEMRLFVYDLCLKN